MLVVSRQRVWNKMLVVKMNVSFKQVERLKHNPFGKKVKQELVRLLGLDIENRLLVESI